MDKVDQGWPHFFYGGQKNGLKKLGGHKNVSQKAWGAKFRLKKKQITIELC